MSVIKHFSFTILLLLPGACQPSVQVQQSDVVATSKLYYSSNCAYGNTKPYSKTLTDRHQLEQAFTKITKNLMGLSRPPAPDVDLDRNLVLLLGMGQKPTAGYALSLAKKSVDVIDDVAQLYINWHEPPPGSITAQVLTSPCILITLPAGTYHSIKVIDQTGKQRFDTIRAR